VPIKARTRANWFHERSPVGSIGQGRATLTDAADRLREVLLISGRQLARHVLLPFLLGFKFNLAALIPLMFGFLLIVTKKALLLTKMALFLSGLLGWNTIFSGATASYPGGFNGFHTHEHEIPGTYSYHDHFPQQPYKTLQDFSPYDQHVIREVVNIYEGSGNSGQSREKKFVWAKNV